jgi:hypothetical protein
MVYNYYCANRVSSMVYFHFFLVKFGLEVSNWNNLECSILMLWSEYLELMYRNLHDSNCEASEQNSGAECFASVPSHEPRSKII